MTVASVAGGSWGDGERAKGFGAGRKLYPVRMPPEAGAPRTLDLTGPPHEEEPGCGAPSIEAGASTKLRRGSEGPA